jgi:SAM-dependent methyltransferase
MNEPEYRAMYQLEADHWWYVGMRAVTAALVDPLPLPPAPRVLDAGCGTGYNLGWLRARGAEVTGVDAFPTALEFCRRRGERALARASIAALPFPDATFDMVVSFDVVSHVREAAARQASLAEFHRVLRPGGAALVRVAAFEWLRTSHDDHNLTYRRFGAGELRRGLAGAGFESVRLTFANTLLFPAAVVWRLLKRAGIGPPGSDVRDTTRGPDWLNGGLARLLRLEAAYLRRSSAALPFGLSLIGLGRKPPSLGRG